MQNRTELAKYFNQLGFKYGAEVGVYKGYYSEVLCKQIPGLKLLCIDSWNSGRRIPAKEAATQLLSSYNAIIIQKNSVDAAKDVEDGSLDFVFIDAGHTYKDVKEDIAVWTPKVRIGGIVSGHDYYELPDMIRYSNGLQPRAPGADRTGLIRAVNEFIEANGYKLQLTDRDEKNPVQDDIQPCWYFLKDK